MLPAKLCKPTSEGVDHTICLNLQVLDNTKAVGRIFEVPQGNGRRRNPDLAVSIPAPGDTWHLLGNQITHRKKLIIEQAGRVKGPCEGQEYSTFVAALCEICTDPCLAAARRHLKVQIGALGWAEGSGWVMSSN